LDPATGLYHAEHFFLALQYEMTRALEAEKPLALLLLRSKEPLASRRAEDLARWVGDFSRKRLRQIDLPANLGGGEFALLLPQVNLKLFGKLARSLVEATARGARLKKASPLFGAALYRPNDSLDAVALMDAARESASAGVDFLGKVKSWEAVILNEDTALKVEEKESLFLGFSSLRER
jgi:GGDEF domain-containing protein